MCPHHQIRLEAVVDPHRPERKNLIIELTRDASCCGYLRNQYAQIGIWKTIPRGVQDVPRRTSQGVAEQVGCTWGQKIWRNGLAAVLHNGRISCPCNTRNRRRGFQTNGRVSVISQIGKHSQESWIDSGSIP